MMNRTKKLQQFVKGRKKGYVAKKLLGVPPQMMSYLLRYDLDTLIEKIDALPVERAA
jgi:hypothetical protein